MSKCDHIVYCSQCQESSAVSRSLLSGELRECRADHDRLALENDRLREALEKADRMATELDSYNDRQGSVSWFADEYRTARAALKGGE